MNSSSQGAVGGRAVPGANADILLRQKRDDFLFHVVFPHKLLRKRGLAQPYAQTGEYLFPCHQQKSHHAHKIMF